MAQIDSAKRSLVTNFISISVFIVSAFLVFLLPIHIRPYFGVVDLTFIKGLMPVLSTVANFGTVKSVFLQYKDYFWQVHIITIIGNMLKF
jgi:hypothetical protein